MVLWDTLKKAIEKIYNETLPNTSGNIATYIPQLGKVNPDLYGISICTVNGERFDIGDTDIEFCLQSCSKPISYCIAQKLNGTKKIHDHIGHEPSGREFNAFILNDEGKPHNPLINSGAIMTASLIDPELEPADRYEQIIRILNEMAGHYGKFGFDNSVYLSEKEHADRNHALAYYMNENNAFPKNCNIQKTLEFYFQICSILSNAKTLSVVAGTLANVGICPLNGEKVFENDIVRNCLSLMYMCGMYDYSGRFAFEVGLPAKSGVSGCLLLVVPKVMGICIFSPRLDKNGNTVRGVEFSKKLVEKFPFHIFNEIVSKTERIKTPPASDPELLTQLFITFASKGNLQKVKDLRSKIDINAQDYDNRSALHLAVAEGEIEMVRYLIDEGANKDTKDRWGSTPIHEASNKDGEKYEQICNILNNYTPPELPKNHIQLLCYEDKNMCGAAAASRGAELIRAAIVEKGSASIIVATGTSQFEMLNNLVKEPNIEWDKVTAFHLDEYVGISFAHKASFRKYLKKRFIDALPMALGEFHYINAEVNAKKECGRLGDIISNISIDVAFIGIGENAHIAFNDPPADFDVAEPFIVVELEEKCKAQQVNEGWFETLDQVPTHAISMSCAQILQAHSLIVTVPGERKALAMLNTIEGEVTNEVPASILQNHRNCTFFCDKDATSMLTNNSDNIINHIFRLSDSFSL